MDTRSHTILVVDDEEQNIKLLQAMLKPEGHTVLTARNGEEALKLLQGNTVDLILLDLMMPGMNGHEVTRRLKSSPATETIPIIMATSLDDRASKLTALEMGAEEFITKPIDRAELWARVRNLLRLKEYNDFLQAHNQLLEVKILERTTLLRESYRDTIFTMTRAAEHRDDDTGAHVQRVSHYALAIAKRLQLPSDFIDTLFYATPMHDVGKIGIPDRILLKPGPLDEDEWKIMRTHTEIGAAILSSGNSPYTQMGAEIALSHHERWDGSGYPKGLSGSDIPLTGRVMCICDVYDALRSRRPYKEPIDHATAVNILLNGDGRTHPDHFDPAVLQAFKDNTEEFAEVFQRFTD